MRMTFLLAGVCVGTMLTVAADSGAGKSISLMPAVSPGEPAQILPGNNIVHLRILDPQRALEEVEKFIRSTAPAELLPPLFRQIMSSEHPLLDALGGRLIGARLTRDAIVERTGLSSTAPATVTLYPGPPNRFFIASVGVADLNRFSAFLSESKMSGRIERMSVAGRPLIRIETERAELRQLYAAFSEERMYLTGDLALLLHLYDTESFPRLGDDPVMNLAAARTRAETIALTVTPNAVKPLLKQLQFFRFAPLEHLARARDAVLAGIPPAQKAMMDQRLRMQLGVTGVDQLADYLETTLSVAYDALFERVQQGIEDFNGFSLSARVDHAYPRLNVHLYSDRYGHPSGTVPVTAVRSALDKMPGDHRNVTVTGKRPKPRSSPWIDSFLDRLEARLERAGLRADWVSRAADLYGEIARPVPIEARVPWVLKTREWVRSPPDIREYDRLSPYFRDLAAANNQPLSREVGVVPNADPALLGQVLKEASDARAANHALMIDPVAFEKRPPMVETLRRFFSEPLDRGVVEFSVETAFLTKRGFFGFNEHELINRKIFHARRVDGYLVWHQASGSPEWIGDLSMTAPGGVSAGLDAFLDRVPPHATWFAIHRNLGVLSDLISWVADVEALAHRDMERYLDAVRESAAVRSEESSGAMSLALSLERIPMPPTVYSVNRDPETGEVYVVLPGNLSFPRPKVAPLLLECFQDFSGAPGADGGFMISTRTDRGVCEWTVIQNLEGISALIQTIGRAMAPYVYQAERRQALLSEIMVEGDGQPRDPAHVLLRNPDLEGFPIKVGGGSESGKPKPAAVPGREIPSRDGAATKQMIDLSDFYNASLLDSWHAGGLPDNDLSRLPRGLQELSGVRFDVRGLVQLAGRSTVEECSVSFPREASSIPVRQKADRIHFLHGAGWRSEPGTTIGTYEILYSDETVESVDIVYGVHVRDWWAAEEGVPSGAEVAWTGGNAPADGAGLGLRLYKFTWANPRPGIRIESIRFSSAMAYSAPFLIAITAERPE